MVKKALLLSITLLASQLTPYANANQTEIEKGNEALENSAQNIHMMEQIYESLAKEYDEKKIEEYISKINTEIKKYINSCIENKNNAKNTDAIEAITNDLLQYLLSETNEDEVKKQELLEEVEKKKNKKK